MKKHLFSATLAVLSIISCSRPEIHANTSELEAVSSLQSKSSLPEQTYSFSVMQFNIWQEGTQVSGGYDAIVNEISDRDPDFVTLSEVRNYNNTSFDQRIVASLKAKGKHIMLPEETIMAS
ncbi:Uncharacterised protein [Elizabethkingia miricola]|nr:Uncharacterised protein [Elizabethkingia miricola]